MVGIHEPYSYYKQDKNTKFSLDIVNQKEKFLIILDDLFKNKKIKNHWK